MNCDYAIIGAGPIGSYLAQKLSKLGHDVKVFEAKDEVGIPVQCTGLFTKKITNYVKMNKEFLVNTLEKVTLHSKNYNITIPSTEYVVNRTKFDRYLMNLAKKSGAKYYLKHRLRDYELTDEGINLIFTNGKKVLTQNVMGCDGPNSKVNQLFQINKKVSYFYGVQHVLEMKKEINENTYHAYFSKKYHDFFAWSVPCASNQLRIGLGNSNKSLNFKRLKQFLKKYDGKIIESNGGPIPIFNNNKVYKKVGNNNIYLLGDAGGIVKATSGGGVVPSFQMINESLPYIIASKKPKYAKTRISLQIHKYLHNMMSKLDDKDLDEIMKDFSDKKVQNVISNISRDNISKLMIGLLKAKPSLLKYIKHLPKMF